jgi:hypothetical protein
MPIKAVVGDVGGAPLVPLNMNWALANINVVVDVLLVPLREVAEPRHRQ